MKDEDQSKIKYMEENRRVNQVDPEACDLSDQKDSLIHARPELKTPYLAPRNDLEYLVADLWQKLFSIDQIGVNDNFFELGGNSILALQLVSRVREIFQIELPLHDFLDEPTISRMVQVIEEHQLSSADSNELKQLLDDLEFLSIEEVREKYADELRMTIKDGE